MRTVAAACFTR
jgi:hypothetical protein